MRPEVSIIRCDRYEKEYVKKQLKEVLEKIGFTDAVKPGMKIAIKANLVSFLNPDKAATTHPVCLAALSDIIREKGAACIIGDSPGGLYNSAYVGRIYKATGMNETGTELNYDFSQKSTDYPEGIALKNFTYTSYLDNVDMIVNFCKLKTHGMMGMSCGVKNMFGVIPGTMKPEYHYKYPDHFTFADMLIDLNEYFRPAVTICDGIVGMEGNGPTAGTPRSIGFIAASESPYLLDLICGSIIGLGAEDVPTIKRACERGLAPASSDQVYTDSDIEDFRINDYKLVPRKSIAFSSRNGIMAAVIRKAMRSYPFLVKRSCIGCRECFRICPAKAITMKNSRPVIKRNSCILCFCCQEFCPEGALKVKRPFTAKLLNR